LDWFEITEFPEQVFRIREPALAPLHGSNLWLVRGRRSSLLIDTGVGVAPVRPIVEALAGNPVICLLTHGHYDHIGGAHEFSDRRAHRLEAAVLADPDPRSTQWQGWLTRDSFSRAPAETFDFDSYSLEPAPPTTLVEDDDRIDLGGRQVTIMHTPGHSPGLISVFEPETGVLFTSDALYDGRMFFELEGSDWVHAARSIERLLATGARRIHPGHFESLSGREFQRLGRRTLEEIERRATAD
jgi:glyoxylase-like metal-dependent hydrolase (beta-lactamase superfamily II)